jgi:PIN domain nuclease of toxin-antitoxin system
VSRRLLLDTCAIIWIATEKSFGVRATAAIDEAMKAGDSLRVSPISAWELGMLCAKGRMSATASPLALFNSVMSSRGVQVEALSPEILVDSSYLPGKLHSDPADRILVATARGRDLTIVTRDRAILEYGEAGHVRTLEC